MFHVFSLGNCEALTTSDSSTYQLPPEITQKNLTTPRFSMVSVYLRGWRKEQLPRQAQPFFGGGKIRRLVIDLGFSQMFFGKAILIHSKKEGLPSSKQT